MSQQSRKIFFAVVAIVLVVAAGGFAVGASHPPITVTSTTTQTIATTTTDQQILQETSTVTSTSTVYSNTVATITSTRTLVAETFQNGSTIQVTSIPLLQEIYGGKSNVGFAWSTPQCLADNFSQQCQQPSINSITVFYNGTSEAVNMGGPSGILDQTTDGYPFGATLAVLVTGSVNSTEFSQWFNIVNPATCELCIAPVILVIGA